MSKPSSAHCLEILTSVYQEHRKCDCKKVEAHGRCTCSCNGPSQCGCTCPQCLRARMVTIEKQPDLFVLMHPHPKTSEPHWFDLGSKGDEHHWSTDRGRARRFATEEVAHKRSLVVTVSPVYVMKLPREEL